jgi:hypothetical protein
MPEKKEKKQKKDKGEQKPSPKAEKKDENFRYIVRIANTDIDGNKTLIMGSAVRQGRRPARGRHRRPQDGNGPERQDRRALRGQDRGDSPDPV